MQQPSTRDQWFRAVIEQIRDHAIFLIGRDGRALTWNEGVRRLLGYDEGEFIGMSVSALFSREEQQSEVPDRELLSAAEEGSASDERWLVRKDGSRLWASGMTSRIEDERGELIGFAKIFRDLTREREFQEMQRRSEERYRLATRATREAIWDRDLNTGTLTWSDGFELLFGYPPDEIGTDVQWWEERIHPEDRERVVGEIAEAINGGATTWEGEYRFRRRKGNYAQVQDRAYIVHTVDGMPSRMLGSMADVTERRRTEEALRQAQRMETVGRLAGGIAHDLNNMLVVILGYSGLLARGLLEGDARREYVDHVMRAAQRSADLTRQLLTFARRQIIRPRPIDPNSLLDDLVPMLRPLCGSAIFLELRQAPEIGLVEADPGQLEQVLVNLVLNARDAMPGGGRLLIETRSAELGENMLARHPETAVVPGRYAVIAVSDTGHGMSNEELKRIFEPFFTTKPPGEGTGLGLASVYGAVKQNRGYVWAYSEPDQGSVFKIYLPLMEAGTLPPKAEEEESQPVRGLETVLVVDDEESVRRLTCNLLRSQGYECLEAAGAEEALELASSHREPIHLMIADVVMPGIGGLELSKRLAPLHPEVRVLFTSGYASDDVIRRGLLRPGLPFLEKPYHPDSLLAIARQLLDQRPSQLSP